MTTSVEVKAALSYAIELAENPFDHSCVDSLVGTSVHTTVPTRGEEKNVKRRVAAIKVTGPSHTSNFFLIKPEDGSEAQSEETAS